MYVWMCVCVCVASQSSIAPSGSETHPVLGRLYLQRTCTMYLCIHVYMSTWHSTFDFVLSCHLELCTVVYGLGLLVFPSVLCMYKSIVLCVFILLEGLATVYIVPALCLYFQACFTLRKTCISELRFVNKRHSIGNPAWGSLHLKDITSGYTAVGAYTCLALLQTFVLL